MTIEMALLKMLRKKELITQSEYENAVVLLKRQENQQKKAS